MNYLRNFLRKCVKQVHREFLARDLAQPCSTMDNLSRSPPNLYCQMLKKCGFVATLCHFAPRQNLNKVSYQKEFMDCLLPWFILGW